MLRRVVDDERGTAATVVLFPLFAVVTFALVQMLDWQHDRQVAASVADRAAVAVALYGASPGGAEVDARRDLAAAGLRDITVSVQRGAAETVVVVGGDAPGILVGTSVRVTARSVTPTERYVAP